MQLDQNENDKKENCLCVCAQVRPANNYSKMVIFILAGHFGPYQLYLFLECFRLLSKTYILKTHQVIKLCKKEKGMHQTDSSCWVSMHEKDPILSNVHILL